MSGYKHDCALGSGEERRRALTTGNGQWGKTDFLRQAEEGVGVEGDPESTQGRLYARGNTTWRRVFVPPSLFPRMSVVPVARFSSSLRMLGRGYLILISLWEFLGSRNLGFLFYHCARQDGGHSFALSLVPSWEGTALPAEALCTPQAGTGCFPTRSPDECPGSCREFHAFPFIVLAPAAQVLPS